MSLTDYLQLGMLVLLSFGVPAEADAQRSGSPEGADTSSTDVLQEAEELKTEVTSQAAAAYEKFQDRVQEINESIERKKGEMIGPLRDSLRNLGEDTSHIDSLLATKFRAERKFRISKARAQLYEDYARIYLEILRSAPMKYADNHADDLIDTEEASQQLRRQIKRLQAKVDSLEATSIHEMEKAESAFEEVFGSKPTEYGRGATPADSIRRVISGHKRKLDIAQKQKEMGQKLRGAITEGFVGMKRVERAAMNARESSKRSFREADALQEDFAKYKRLISVEGDSDPDCIPIPSDPCDKERASQSQVPK